MNSCMIYINAGSAALVAAPAQYPDLSPFEIARASGHIEGGKARHYQVTLKVGFTTEEAL
jgi:flavin-binding protein dodecin